VIIPDGNRRWAKARGLPAIEGHRKGAEVVEGLVWRCRDAGVKVLTLWGFSTENWGRAKDEIEYLMDLFVEFLTSVEGHMHSEQVRFRHLGRKDRLSAELLAVIQRLETETAEHTKYNLNVCIDYGGRDEVIRGVKRALDAGVAVEELDEEKLAAFLDTGGLPDPDLIIRTSGEHRLSGILPFQSVYSELAFVPIHLPDMTKEVLEEIFDEYAQRKRRYGK
jgi:undecaprenyl diphosphate synthase